MFAVSPMLALTAILAAGAPAAQPTPSGPLGLIPGRYAKSPAACQSPTGLGAQLYDGQDLHPVGHACRSEVLWSDGAVFRLRQWCPVPDRGWREAGRPYLRVTGVDAFQFVQVARDAVGRPPVGRKAVSYSRCPADDRRKAAGRP